jgi:hypothetical protein
MNITTKIWSLIVLGCAASATAAAQSPPPNSPAAPPDSSATPTAPAVKAGKPTAQSEAGEPRADTSAPAAAAGAEAAAPAPSRGTPSARSPSAPPRAAAAPAQAAAPGQKPPPKVDRLDLGTATVTGDREQPKVLYIVPWKKSDIGDLAGKPMNSLVDEILTPVDRDVFRREVVYYQAVQATASQNAAPPKPAQQGEK